MLELLVVTAMLSILILLIFTGISSMRSRAHRIQCLNNAKHIATAGILAFEDSDPYLPMRSAWDQWGEAGEDLLPYLNDSLNVFDCPANPGTEDFAICKMPSYECYTEYELNGLLCSTPAQQQRNDGITIPSQAAYVYDFPYYPGASPHEEGVNCGYLDGHAAWLPFDEMGLDGPEGDRFYRKGHQY